MRDRVKIKSDKATYEVVDVRVLRKPEGAMPDLLTHHPSLRGGETRSLNGLPETLALNIAAPCEAPSISGWRPASPCWILLLVLKIADHARVIATDEPDVSKWPPGLRLCRRWLRDAPNDPYLCARLKGVFQVRALDGEQLPRVFAKWSGKPVLMAAAGALSRRHGLAEVLWRKWLRRGPLGHWRVLQLHGQGSGLPHDVQTLDARRGRLLHA